MDTLLDWETVEDVPHVLGAMAKSKDATNDHTNTRLQYNSLQ